jgi:cytochrome b involved in lipid metabolism
MKLLVLALLGVLLVSGCTQTETVTGDNGDVQEEMRTITLSEVAEHNEAGDCWLAIDGKIYDVSSWNAHPGGAAILEGCGKDATELFETRPMGSGTPHSEDARSRLPDFYIGDIV